MVGNEDHSLIQSNQSDCEKKCYLYAHTDLIMPVGGKKEEKKVRKRNKGKVLVNHRGSDKALKLK